MSLLLFAALAVHLLAIGMRQAAAVGEILTGLVPGPSVPGRITYTVLLQALHNGGRSTVLALEVTPGVPPRYP